MLAARRVSLGQYEAVSELVLTQVASDNFNRSNGAIAGSNNWAAISSGGMSILSNELIGSSGSQLGNIRTGETYTSNHYSQCTVGSVALVTGGYIAPSVRNQDNANGYVLLYFDNGGVYQLGLYKKVAGSYTNLTTTTIGVQAQGTTIQLIAEGSTLQALVGGSPVFAIVDTTFTSGGVPGVESYDANSLDNWAGGNAATGTIGAALATDNFNRANGNVSVGNSNWVLMNYPYSGGATVECPIVSNQISTQNPPVTYHAGDVRTDSYNNNQWSMIQMGTTAMNGSGFVGVTTRLQGSGGTLGNSGYLAVNFNATVYRIYRLDNGTSTMLASTGQSQFGNDPAGTTYQLVSQGARHSLRLNGSEILSAVDSTYNGGPPGIMMFGNSSADNWSAGNV
jgi:hypothetical protein